LPATLTRFLAALSLLALLSCETARAADPALRASPKPDGTVAVEYQMSAAGHVTLAIDNAQGVRVRNLIADVPAGKGAHTAPWDGLDDDGAVVPVGNYRLVGLSRGDLHVVFRRAFSAGNPPWEYGTTGGWGADHTPVISLIALGDRMYLGSHTTEGGSGIFCTDTDGKKIWGLHTLDRVSWQGGDCMVTDGERLFAKGRPDYRPNTIWEVDTRTGKSWFVIKLPETKEGLPVPAAPFDNIGGLRPAGAHRTGPTRWDGELYICDIQGKTPRTYVFSTAKASESDTGYDDEHFMKFLRVLPIRIWNMLWLPDGRCIAALDASVVVLDPKTGATQPFIAASALEAPYAMCLDGKGRLYVSDWGGSNPPTDPNRAVPYMSLRKTARSSMQVKIFDLSSRKLLRAMGKPGGSGTPDGHHEAQGVVDPRDFFRPSGVAIDAKGRLWVGEQSIQPKRISVWDIPDDLKKDEPTLAKLFIGRPQYGEALTMPDPQKPNLLLMSCQGVLLDTSLETGEFKNLERRYNASLCGGMFSGLPVNPVRLNGRTFAMLADWGFGQTVLGEVKGAAFVPLASFGAASAYAPSDTLPPALKTALTANPQWAAAAQAAKIDPTLETRKDIDRERWPPAFNGYNWTDANGDALWQPEEIKFSELRYDNGPLWTFDTNLNALVNMNAHQYWMKLKGFNSVGAPMYDLADLQPVDIRALGHRGEFGADGSILFARGEGSKIRLCGPDGRERWSYPMGPSDGGYDRVPKERLIDPGFIIGENGQQGIVKGPGDLGDVFMIHGWHGMNYFLTRDDGLFIGTAFKPHALAPPLYEIPEAKPGILLDGYTLGGENFGGSFARADASVAGYEKGHYYILGYSYNLVTELTGLDTVKRLTPGSFARSAADVAKTRQAAVAKATEIFDQREKLAAVDIPPGPDATVEVGLPNPNWINPSISLWHTKEGLGLRAVYAAPSGPLHIPKSFFLNDAPAWEQAYAFGDCLELQFGVDPAADPKRTQAVEGDQHLVLAQLDGKPLVVRYVRMPTDKAPAGAKVLEAGRAGSMAWVAEKLDVARGDVKRQMTPTRVEVSIQALIPWKDLGMTYEMGHQFRGNLGVVLRQNAGKAPWYATYVGSTGLADTDFAAALELHPNLWIPLTLRPAGYTPPPDMRGTKTLVGPAPIALKLPPERAKEPVAYSDAFTWVDNLDAGLRLKWYVTQDNSPFVNKGTDWTHLFKTGDACDLQIASPELGKCRYLITVYEGQPVVVRYVYTEKSKDLDLEESTKGVMFESPVSKVYVPVVERLPIEPKVERGDTWYTVDVTIPWQVLGVKRTGKVPVELGVLRSDATGTRTAQRNYWHSGLSGMVQDVPTEVKPMENWGELVFP